jgi:uncharacterized protein (UPF0297 family)
VNLNALKKFAQAARRKLMNEVSTRLDYLLSHDDAYVRAHEDDLKEIRRQLAAKGREHFVEEAAYTWFNRLVAFRYMDLRGYTKVRVVSPQAGQVQPELLFQIKQGRTPKELEPLQSVFDGYLDGSVTSDQPDREVYTAALLGMCNDYSRTLPFLFRKVDDYMAVLLPTDLLSESSIIAEVQRAITEDDVADVEVIGWLYQFYISEKKDQVFGRPKGEKIKKEDIPAATQLFTPHWIVRYMVENSLGRLWRNNRPDTGLKERMEYYIEGDPEPEFLKIEGPEEITLLDPACGSGHILTYAFDLLYGMYEETGYSAEEIPSLILTNNLYGIDIDTRAAELAAFALTMKAREKDRFFFKRGVVPRVIAMEDVSVDLREADIRMSPQLQEAFGYLSEATNFGSLIPVPAEVQGEIEDLLADLDARGDADLFADQAMGQVRSGLRQLGYLAKRYHCVVTNPPYMGNKASNPVLRRFLTAKYELNKEDMYAAFLLMLVAQCLSDGYCASVTQRNWLYKDKYEKIRKRLLRNVVISIIDIGPGAFEQISGEVVSVSSAIQRNSPVGANHIWVQRESKNPRRWLAQAELLQFPKAILPLSLSPYHAGLLGSQKLLSDIANPRSGLTTGDSDRFILNWFEVSHDRVGPVWVSVNAGGTFRRWYGNNESVIQWQDDGRSIRSHAGSTIANMEYQRRRGLTWGKISGDRVAVRYSPEGAFFTASGLMAFPEEELLETLGLLNSSVASRFLSALAPDLDTLSGDIAKIPFIPPLDDQRESLRQVLLALVAISKAEWDNREISADYESSPLLKDHSASPTKRDIDDVAYSYWWPRSQVVGSTLEDAYGAFADVWTSLFDRAVVLEHENDVFFIQLYALDQDIESDISYSSITLLVEELNQAALRAGERCFNKSDILQQFVSYGVGCIFGRYSLDKDGLILANAGDDLDAYLSQIPEPTVCPDESGILPITDDNDFADDLPSQWRAFLRAAFGDEHYEENLRFLEDGLGKRLRSYFLKGFYDDHVKRYKKRPIYWLITSPKGTLQALIYLHRYNRDTVNRFLNDYLRPYQQKLEAKRVNAEHVLTGGGSSQSEKTKAQKRIDEIRKALEELSTWERDVVRPLAEKRIELDLDDGVKVNYGKLGAILAKVKGLNG